MATLVDLVQPSDTFGGLRDGYRQTQSGLPNTTAGNPPAFQGKANAPGQQINAPNIRSSAVRQNQGTNVTIPYARVAPADEVSSIGRVAPGDVLFVHRNSISTASVIRKNHEQMAQITTSVSVPHARVQRVAGLDYINHQLGKSFNYRMNDTILVNSVDPSYDWRSLAFLRDWTLDGIVMSDDSPGFALSNTADVRNDRVFNVAIQGPAQVNNGFEDYAGHGVMNMRPSYQNGFTSYQFEGQYPLQMFDRKVRPMCEFYIGLVCKKIERADTKYTKLFEELIARKVFDDYKDWNEPDNKGSAHVTHIHVFQFVLFSSRQMWQFSEARASNDPYKFDGSNGFDAAIVDSVVSEPAHRRRGPLDTSKDVMNASAPFNPRKRQKSDTESFKDHNFSGLKFSEVLHMVGAWRLGRVLDVASSRKQIYTGGPIDTAFRVTLNVDISFLDWRALRRTFTIADIGGDNDNCPAWGPDIITDNAKLLDNITKRKIQTQTMQNDDGRILQWPTQFKVYTYEEYVTGMTETVLTDFATDRKNKTTTQPPDMDSKFYKDNVNIPVKGDEEDRAAVEAARTGYVKNSWKNLRQNQVGGKPTRKALKAYQPIKAPPAGGAGSDASQSVVLPAHKSDLPPFTQPVASPLPLGPQTEARDAGLSKQVAGRDQKSAEPEEAAAVATPSALAKTPLDAGPVMLQSSGSNAGDGTLERAARQQATKDRSKQRRAGSSGSSGGSVVGEDVMASIFGASEHSAPAETTTASELPRERPRHFPRRNRDR